MKNVNRITWPLTKLLRDYKIARLAVIILTIWLIGASILWFTEGAQNIEFNSLPKSIWNIAVYLFSGLDSGVPQTTIGKIIVTMILVMSLGIVGIFTATIASMLVEHRIGGKRKMRIGGKRKMPKYELKNHIVICNWNTKGLPLVKEVHAKIVTNKRPIVIITDQEDEVDFPEHEDVPEFEDVYIIKGDPTNEIILKRANVHNAYTVVVLADPKQGDLADAKSILVCMGIRRVRSSQKLHHSGRSLPSKYRTFKTRWRR